MINIFEVNETNKMIEHENLDVRTITMGISLLDCIDSDLGDFVEYVRPQGGLFIWCKLPGDVDMLDFCKRAIAKQVAVVPGNAFMMDDKAVSHHIRLNFSTPSDQAIVAGVHRLGEVAADLRSK